MKYNAKRKEQRTKRGINLNNVHKMIKHGCIMLGYLNYNNRSDEMTFRKYKNVSDN